MGNKEILISSYSGYQSEQYITTVQHNDKIRVSITTVPDERKEAFVIEANKSNNIHHFFTVNVSNQTQRIIFVFRKVTFFGSNHIMASTVIPMSDLPQSENDKNNTEMKTLKIYEPYQHMNNNVYAIKNRRVFGEMEIQFTPTEKFPLPSMKDNYNNYKKKAENKHSTVDISAVNNSNYMGYGYVPNENQNNYQKYSYMDDQKQFNTQNSNVNQNNYQNYSYVDGQNQLNTQNSFENQYNATNQNNEVNLNQQENQYGINQCEQPIQNQPQVLSQPQNQMVFVNDLI